MEERKYFVKSGMRTNLDSMITKLHCFRYDMQDGEYDTVNVMGKTYDADTIWELIQECADLLGKANFGKVTGKEYGRIKYISEYRDMLRYATCIAKGMDESRAQYAFMS